MKRILFFIPALLCCVNVFSQNVTLRIQKIQLYQYRESDEGWDFLESYRPDSMYMNYGNGVLTINDEYESCFEIGQPLNSAYIECENFMAADNKNEPCGVQFCFNKAMTSGALRVLYVGSTLRVYILLE